jgi:hypothetical protein
MKKLSNALIRFSTGPVTLLALVIFIVFTATVLPAQSMKAAMDEISSPDLLFWYSPASLYKMAEANGITGRQEFVRSHFTFDLAWPAVYVFFLVTALSWLVSRGFPEGSPWRMANLLPLAAVCFDLLENISSSLVMSRYPAQTPLAADLAPFFTATKWILVGACILLLFVGIVAALRARIKK